MEHQVKAKEQSNMFKRAILACTILLIALVAYPISSYADETTTTVPVTTTAPPTTAPDDIDTPIPGDTTPNTTSPKQKTVAQEKASKANSQLNKSAQKLLEVQLAADKTSQEIQGIRSSIAELDDKIAKNEALIAVKELPLEQLSRIIKKRAVTMYQEVGATPTDPMEKFLFEKQSALSGSAQASNVEELKEFNKQQNSLLKVKKDLDTQKEDNETKQAELETLSQQFATQLEAAKLEYEKTAGFFLDAHAVIGLRSAINGMMCPIAGPLSHIDDFGFPRSGGRRHKGNDIFNAYGTPNVAIVSGTITHQNGGLGGMAVKLQGDDGSIYYYAHLSAFAGGPRRVAQGEVIGFTGDSGNAKGGAPHTHFEIRPGGVHTNPYPIVRIICGA